MQFIICACFVHVYIGKLMVSNYICKCVSNLILLAEKKKVCCVSFLKDIAINLCWLLVISYTSLVFHHCYLTACAHTIVTIKHSHLLLNLPLHVLNSWNWNCETVNNL